MWQTKYSKLSLSIRDKTEHQRRHLSSIMNMKSRVDSKQPWKKSPSSSKSSRVERTIERPYLSPFAVDKMKHENCLLANKIIDISKRGINKQKITNMFSTMSRSLSSIVVNNRNRVLRTIDKENEDIYKRLVSAKPLYPTVEMKRFVSNNSKYKNNILRAKVHNIDYTKLAVNKKPSINKFKLISMSGDGSA